MVSFESWQIAKEAEGGFHWVLKLLIVAIVFGVILFALWRKKKRVHLRNDEHNEFERNIK